MTIKNDKKTDTIERERIKYTETEKDVAIQYMAGKTSLTSKELKKIVIKVNLDQNVTKKQFQQYFKDQIEFSQSDILLLFRILASIQANVQIASQEFYSPEFEHIVQFKPQIAKEMSAISLMTQSPQNKGRGSRTYTSFSHNGSEYTGEHQEPYFTSINHIHHQLPRHSIQSHNVGTHLPSAATSLNNTIQDKTQLMMDDVFQEIYENSKSDTPQHLTMGNDLHLYGDKYELQHASHYQNYQFGHYKSIKLSYLANKKHISEISSNVTFILDNIKAFNNIFINVISKPNQESTKTIEQLNSTLYQEQQTSQRILQYSNKQKQNNLKLQQIIYTFKELSQGLNNRIQVIQEQQEISSQKVQHLIADFDAQQKKKITLIDKIKRQQKIQQEKAMLLGFIKYSEYQEKMQQNILSSASNAVITDSNQSYSTKSFWEDAEGTQMQEDNQEESIYSQQKQDQ